MAVVLVLVATGACGGNEPVSAPGASALHEGGDRRATVLALRFEGELAELRRLDALTLRPTGPAASRGLPAGIHVVSPDRRTIVLATGHGGGVLRFVDLRSLRVQGTVELPGPGWPSEFLWERPDRLTVLLQGETPSIAVVNPRTRRLRGVRPLAGPAFAFDRRAGRLAVLLSPSSSIGPSRLAVVDAARGLVGTVSLPAILSGSERIESAADDYAIRTHSPGVAVSPDGNRAVVVAAGNRVAEVDLDTLRVAYHDLSQSISLLGRLRNWVEPQAAAKVMEGPHRFARFVGERYVAVTGTDYQGIRNGEWQAEPAGLRLIDTRDWSVRTSAEQVTGLVRVRDLVLAFGGNWPEGAEGTGLLAYGADGEELFHALGPQRVGWVETAWPYAYVANANGRGQRFQVVDLRTGAVVATARTNRTTSILGADGSG